MTGDAVMILVNAMVLDRDTVAASLNDSTPWDSFEILEPWSTSARTPLRWCTAALALCAATTSHSSH